MGWMRPDPNEADESDILGSAGVDRHRKARAKGLALMFGATAFICLDNIDDKIPIPSIINLAACIPLGMGAGRLIRHNEVLLRHANALEQLHHELPQAADTEAADPGEA